VLLCTPYCTVTVFWDEVQAGLKASGFLVLYLHHCCYVCTVQKPMDSTCVRYKRMQHLCTVTAHAQHICTVKAFARYMCTAKVHAQYMCTVR